MDIEGSPFTTADLLSLRYPLSSNGAPCSSGSLLLSSPWPISSTPSPPSSTTSSSSLATLSDGTLLSISSSSPLSCSPPSSIPSANSPVPSDLNLGSVSSGCGATAVIFTTSSGSGVVSSSTCSPSSSSSLSASQQQQSLFTTAALDGRSGAALTLVDPVSTHTLEVAHAPGKSILCVHEQDHGDLIHFSSSPSAIANQLNHVNGNGNESGGNSNSNANTSSIAAIMDAAGNKDFITVQNSSLLQHPISSSSSTHSIPSSSTTTTLPLSTNNSTNHNNNNTDGNLFPTLILTSAGSTCDESIPMRLYASLTSSSTTGSHSLHNVVSSHNDNCTSSLNGSILTTTADNGGSGTCILMTPMHTQHSQHLPNSLGSNELHHVLISTTTNDNDTDGTTFALSGFTTSTNHDECGSSDIQTGSLGGTSLLMDDCYEKTPSSSSTSIDDYSSHGKLKDILMNGNSHQHGHRHHHHHHHSNIQNLNQAHHSNSPNLSTNGETYILRDLEGAPNSNSSVGTSFIIPKEEDDALVEELKLHSVVEEQSSFSEAINSIYHSSSSSRNPFCDGNSQDVVNGDLIMVTSSDGQHDQLGVPISYGGSAGVISAIGSPPALISIPPSSLNSGSSSGTSPSVIWTNSGGIVESLPSSIPPQMMHLDHNDTITILKDEDIGDFDGIEDEDLLEAKEEMDDLEEYGEGDGQGGKGELKCKFCGFVCCSKSSLGIHERRHTGERPFACKYCGRLFNSAQCCKHHERLHTGDKPFQCSYCGKKYAVSTRLKRHERVHTREEPYKCTECNKTFRWFDAFRDHRNTHTGVPLYLCSVCGKTFTSYLKFYYHERGHLMKKERDRDRLLKQKGLANGTSLGAWLKKVTSMPAIPITNTIDIMKSLQRNSSAGIISTLNSTSAQIGGSAKSNKGSSTVTGKGNAKKGTAKGKK